MKQHESVVDAMQPGVEAAAYASGNWVVQPGHDTEFVARWKEFLGWTRETAAGFRWAILIRDQAEASHFISLAGWSSNEELQRWKSLPAFAEKLGACRAHCDAFRGSNYELMAIA